MNDSVAAELAIKAQQGDMQAFEQLYTEFSPLIYSILLEITHDTYETEDLTQDCFVSAIKNIHTLKDPSKIKKWLTAIAANHGKDYLKKKKPALLGEEHEYIFDIQEEKNEALLPEESAVLDERSEEIREIVNSVSEDKRLCLVLFYQHEMSITEISEELGISESAVKSRLFRAREDIREEVEKRNKKGMPLFGIAPLPLILFALQKSSQAAEASFAGSAAQTAAFASISAASQAGIAASSAAVTATTAAASTTTATTAAATGTGIAAKVAALSVAQKVIAGVSVAAVVTGSGVGVATVVKSNSEKDLTTTAFVEEVTTAPSFEEDFILPIIAGTSETAENSSYAETDSSSAAATNRATSNRASTSVSKSESQAATSGTTAKNSAATTKKQTTTKAQTTTKKQTTTKSATTTKASTTAKSATTTKSQTTTKAATTTTTKAATTTKAVTTTTTKAATTTTTTESSSPATVTVTVWGEETSTTKTLYFEAGETITATEIENRLSDEYGIEAIADDINITAEAGGSYTATAYE